MFGLMRISNLMHGSFFMLGRVYFGVTLLAAGGEFLARGGGERPPHGDYEGREAISIAASRGQRQQSTRRSALTSRGVRC